MFTQPHLGLADLAVIDDIRAMREALASTLRATDTLARRDDTDPMVTAAMAHLNLVMIYPFPDGNGRGK